MRYWKVGLLQIQRTMPTYRSKDPSAPSFALGGSCAGAEGLMHNATLAINVRTNLNSIYHMPKGGTGRLVFSKYKGQCPLTETSVRPWSLVRTVVSPVPWGPDSLRNTNDLMNGTPIPQVKNTRGNPTMLSARMMHGKNISKGGNKRRLGCSRQFEELGPT